MTKINNEEFISFSDDKFEIYFSIGDKNYNRKLEKGRNNIEKLKDIFELSSIKYLTQIHSDKIINVSNVNEETNSEEADGLITILKNVGVGVFYADCVPVILYDKVNEVISAVHSGWRGTYDEIVNNAISMMKDRYKSKEEDIKVIIGPHIRQCCYEVSEELRDKFNNKESFQGENLFEGRNLSLEKVILKTLRNNRIKEENIQTIKLCTCCDTNNKLHSYRRDGNEAGRCYSFIVKR